MLRVGCCCLIVLALLAALVLITVGRVEPVVKGLSHLPRSNSNHGDSHPFQLTRNTSSKLSSTLESPQSATGAHSQESLNWNSKSVAYVGFSSISQLPYIAHCS